MVITILSALVRPTVSPLLIDYNCLISNLFLRSKTIEQINHVLDTDRDRKLVMALITFERSAISDLFFGIHSLFKVLWGSKLRKLDFPVT